MISRQRGKSELLAMQARLAAIVSSASEAILTKTFDGTITSWNAAAERLLGYKASEIVGKPVHSIIPLWRLKEEDEILARVAAGEQIENYDTERIAKDGRAMEVALTVSPLRVDGRLIEASSIMHDASARKRAAEELQRQAQLLDLSKEAIFTWRLRGAIESWNEGAVALYGYSRQEAIGRVSHDLLATENHPGGILAFVRELESTGRWSGELIHRAKDGRTVIVESSQQLFRQGAGELVLETNRDVTGRKRREEHNLLLLREVNHRSKNLLAVVAGIARQTARASPHDFLSSLSDRIEALAASHDLLVESQWRGVDLGDLVRAELSRFQELVGTRIGIEGPSLRLSAHAAQTIGLALHELATNAVKYGALSNATGHVDIAWQLTERDGIARMMLTWAERGGPPVSPPSRKGFGTTLIREAPKSALRAEVELLYGTGGLFWRLNTPADAALEDAARMLGGSVHDGGSLANVNPASPERPRAKS
jgi:PAS domain S-box-containing protein